MEDAGIRIVYKYVDGAHFFIPAGDDAKGLCVAHADLRTAFDEVGRQLEALCKFNKGEVRHYAPAMPFDKFKEYVESVLELTHDYMDVGFEPSATQAWMKDVRG